MKRRLFPTILLLMLLRVGHGIFGYSGYQQAWAGMNEAGLMVSTMALNKTRAPAPDARPPLLSPFWIQYLFRSVDFAQLDFSCRTPVMLLDVQANLSGDVSTKFVPYSHVVSLNHTLRFMEQYGRSDDYPPVVLDVLLRGLESFACTNDPVDATAGQLVLYRPLIPPIVPWVGLTVLHYAWPLWLLLTALSLVVVIWRSARGSRLSWNARLAWALAVVWFGPFGLLAYVLTARKR